MTSPILARKNFYHPEGVKIWVLKGTLSGNILIHPGAKIKGFPGGFEGEF